jgi:gliding motility-associated-like protein
MFNPSADSAYAGISLDSLCDTVVFLGANVPRSAGGRGVWSVVSGDDGIFGSAGRDTLRANGVFYGKSGNTYRLRWTISTPSCGSTFDEITLRFAKKPGRLTVLDTFVCGDNKNTTLVAFGAADGDYRWYTTASDTTPIEGEYNSILRVDSVKKVEVYYVTSKLGNCEGPRVPIRIDKYTVPRGTVSRDVIIELGESTQLIAQGGVVYQWSPVDGLDDAKSRRPIATPKETTKYTVRIYSRDSCYDVKEVLVTVIKNLNIPNAFTPNEDGVNDNWVLRSIENYPRCKVEVFNRWGIRLFNSTGYKTPWDGKYNGSYVPIGPYTYVVDLGDGTATITGTVTIIR